MNNIKRNTVIFAIIALAYSGCASKKSYVAPSKTQENTYYISADSGLSDFGFVHTKYNNTMYAALQLSAKTTLDNGFNYFEIKAPKSISNTADGSMTNTAKEFIEKCKAGHTAVFTGSLDNCNIHPYGNRTNAGASVMDIKLHKLPQKKVLVYDAKKIISYLKKNDLFDNNPPVLIGGTVNKTNRSDKWKDSSL